MTALSVLSVASEAYPLVKTGGLADVVGALPAALAAEGVLTRTLLPGYPAVLRAIEGRLDVTHDVGELFGGRAHVLAGRAGGLDLLVLRAPHLYDRPGGPYADAVGRDWPDNAWRFAALARIAERLGRGMLPDYLPDLLHAHDWQAGLVPAFLHYGEGRRPSSVFTIHNLAFQGQFPARILTELGLPAWAGTVEGVEYYGAIGYLKAGVRFADRVTTVSPTYADEIRTPDSGMGMDGLLRARGSDVSGILNGLDEDVWDPAADPHLPASFSVADLDGRRSCRQALVEELGLHDAPGAIILGVVSRLSWQKGMDVLLNALPSMLRRGARIAVLGTGDASIQDGFGAVARAHPGRVGMRLGYDERLAHLIQAGCDVLVVPSRFEPCGLTQLCALRYGAVPLVARTGGLADTVVDANEAAVAAGVATGVQVGPLTRESLEAAFDRITRLWRRPDVWRQVQRNAMSADVGWRNSARRYAALYRAVHAERTN